MTSPVDQIRQLLDKRDGLSVESMRPLAAAYSEEVTRVNERLRDAAQLLRKGLRSEAIQRASLHPNAIEGAANLDFPEYEDWFEILQFLAIPLPPDLDRDAAEQLNEAIVETQPLNKILKQHRRLAIARAPLAWRLRILRRLAALDLTSSVWEEDLESWEEARLKQIPGELQAAIKAEDTDKVASIVDELADPSWRNTPDPKLVDQARTALRRFAHEAHLERLRVLVPQLHDAFNEFNEAEARRLRDELRSTEKRMTDAIPADLAEHAEPALLWLEEIDREANLRQEHAVAVAGFEAALDAHAPASDLQRAFHQATRFDEPLSPELQQRYRVAMEERQLAAKRKTQAVIAGIGAATLLMAAVIGYWQYQSLQERKVAAAHAQLKGLLDAEKLSEAEGLWKRIESSQPQIAASTQLAQLASQLTTMLANESSRAAQFADYLEQADAEDPAHIDLSALARAENLAANEEEKASAFRIRRRRSQWESEVTAQHSKAVTTAVAEFTRQLDQFESMSASRIETAEIAALIAKLKHLEATYPRRGSAASGEIDLVRSRAAAMKQAVEEQRQQMDAIERAHQRVIDAPSLKAFAEGLEAFARDAPDSPAADEFAQAATEQPLWERALAWNSVAAALSSSLSASLTPDQAQSLLERNAELRRDLEQNPAELVAPEWRTRLEEVANRTKVLDELFAELPQTVIAELNTAIDAEKNRYFVYKSYQDRYPEKFDNRNSGTTSIDVVSTESGAVAGEPAREPITTLPEPRSTIRWLSERGQSERNAFLTNWNQTFLRTIAELRSRPDLDGTIKEMLLLHLLEGACKGNPALKELLADELQLLRARGEFREQWYVAGPANSQLDPEIEQKVVAALSSAYRTDPSSLRELHTLAERRYRWIGFLTRDSSGSIDAHVKDAPDTTGLLLIVRASLSDPGRVTWVPVGTWESDQPKLDRTSADLTAGRPLFFLGSPLNTDS
ncbi:coiled-coil domain-containing protein [Candidatus Laterigemmans baculatus]|uniref:hypothetical protein n=1 Tax=Candidatus Laterigemmans baculatus TaxID=2770505 RepID=UPI0013D996E4|nr:hypothetical protein [Candidatus Laterigemmans baculatus]